MKNSLVAITLASVLVASVFVFRLQSAVTAVPSPSISDRLGLGADFLEQLYNASIGLCRETLVEENETFNASNGTIYHCYTNETYWIASDNFLDSLALMAYNLTLSENISRTCSTYYNGSYFPYQIIQGGYIPLTLHVANTYVLENTSDYIIVLNLYNGTVDSSNYLDYPAYADTLVYEALNYYVQGYPLDWCNNLYMEAYDMFDGKGIADSAFYGSTPHVYANMKLALLVFGAKVLNLNVCLAGIEQQLWSAQKMNGSEMGGITSLMDSSGQPIGSANGETTALTLLAYRPCAETKDSISVTFPLTSFNHTTSIATDLTAIPLLSNWKVTIDNSVQWAPNQLNPRVALGFYSSLANPGNLSIQLVEYSDGSPPTLDINAHDTTHPSGYTLKSIHWANPLTISLVSNTLNVSSPSGTYVTSFPSFRLAYITAGSTPLIGGTNESGICVGGEVDIQVEVLPKSSPAPIPIFILFAILTLLVIMALLAVAVYRRRQRKSSALLLNHALISITVKG